MQYQLLRENVKIIGRTLENNGTLWCGLSGTGIAFTCEAKEVALTLRGDDSTTGNETEGQARFAIYVNGVRVVDDLMKKPEQQYKIWNSPAYEKISVQVIKLSECPMSTIGICPIEADTRDGIHPTEEKKRKIEIIGDSITCGYGVDRENPDTGFETATEDVTRAYSYKLAQALDADYSFVSYSGYGLISGYTDTDQPLKEQLVSTYYEKVGFSYAKPEGTIVLADQSWDFHKFQPQLVLINLGTNDDSYCKDYVDRLEEFQQLYVDFLKVVRRHNPKAQILCVVGVMEEQIYAYIEKAVSQFCEQTGDSKVSSLHLPLQLPEDGFVSDSHPTEITHTKAAKLLEEYISHRRLI
ncbi:MAG: GDSL-type esterase/lipase family protein [bacterium]|nr:GDSL-type esterase/lipase family protein [bacterium]